MAILTRDKPEPAPAFDAEQAADAAERRSQWAARRLHWHRRLECYERDALETKARLSPSDQKTIKDLYAQARACWEAEDPPEGWRLRDDVPDTLPFEMTLQMRRTRKFTRVLRLGDVNPDTGRTIRRASRSRQ